MEENEVYIKVTKDGPYLVYGVKKIAEDIILTDENGVCTGYGEGKTFEIKANPTALCRCGKSKNAPFCDGAHSCEGFDGTETASFEPMDKMSMSFGGPNLNLMDNESLCAYARFCDAKGSIWHLIRTGTQEDDEQAIKEANLCPSGRLLMFDKDGNVIEDKLPQSIGILEDTGMKISGPLWIKGSIRVESADGKSYEVRNRQTLCRCGKSSNKPFCNGAHAKTNFQAEYKKTEN